MKKIEILAPAGSYESLIAAVNAGCDAVYIGGSKFGARAYANNLTQEDLLKAIDYVHIHDKRLYLTINTLLKEEELEQELLPYLKELYEKGLDAVIVQDIGVMNFIHKNFKDLPIHASTQMTITMAKGIEAFSELGVTRLVTSRELSLLEIKEISENTNMEIESFVHGALCFCYSGQCFMSSMLGGRSGNRGRCAQPCRMPYTIAGNGKINASKEEKYLLSPKDICTLHIIPELIHAGIDSFKIEGRMKKAEYTALVVYLYRKYVDLYLQLGDAEYEKYLKNNKKSFDQDVMMLMDMYNRGGFTEGYYNTHNGKDMMANKRPNHSGVFVGDVVEVKGINATIKTKENINSQDVLEIRTSHEEAYEFTVKNSSTKGDLIYSNFMPKYKIKPGQEVYRTKNNKLLTDIKELYLKDEVKVLIDAKLEAKLGLPISLTLIHKEFKVTVYGDEVQSAMKQPITYDKIFSQINKTNTTSFAFETLNIEMDEQIFIPVVKLNELRRNAIEVLTIRILDSYRRDVNSSENVMEEVAKKQIIAKDKEKVVQETGISVHLLKLEHLYEALKHKEVDHIYIDTSALEFKDIKSIADLVVSHQKKFYLVLPYIFRKETYALFLQNKEYLRSDSITGFVIKNLEEYSFIFHDLYDEADKKGRRIEVILDYNLYTMNNKAKDSWRNKGVDHFTSSIELNYQELKTLGCTDSDLIVYGHLPLMVTAQCLTKNSRGCTKKIETISIIDRYNKKFHVTNQCQYCYNIIYNGNPISLLKNNNEVKSLNPKNIRLDFTLEENNLVNEIINAFICVYKNKDQNNADVYEIKDYTKGHFKRGIE